MSGPAETSDEGMEIFQTLGLRVLSLGISGPFRLRITDPDCCGCRDSVGYQVSPELVNLLVEELRGQKPKKIDIWGNEEEMPEDD